MPLTPEERRIIDLEHREERREDMATERAISEKSYAKKDYETAMKWAIILLASGIFIALANTVTDGVVKKIFSAIRHENTPEQHDEKN